MAFRASWIMRTPPRSKRNAIMRLGMVVLPRCSGGQVRRQPDQFVCDVAPLQHLVKGSDGDKLAHQNLSFCRVDGLGQNSFDPAEKSRLIVRFAFVVAYNGNLLIPVYAQSVPLGYRAILSDQLVTSRYPLEQNLLAVQNDFFDYVRHA